MESLMEATERAGEVWRRIVATHLLGPAQEVHRDLQQLEDLAERLCDPSLHFAVRQAHHIARDGISGINVMGTMGSGKSAVGAALAEALGKWRFVDADTFHPQHNIEKMRAGEPLSDHDRLTFLTAARDFFRSERAVISSCSALKDAYRAVVYGSSALSHEASRWSFPEPTLGLITVCLIKPFHVTLEQLDYTEKTPGARRTLRGEEHFIHVTEENPTILREQFAAFEPPKPWQSIEVYTECFRDSHSASGTYNTTAVIEHLLGALGMRLPLR